MRLTKLSLLGFVVGVVGCGSSSNNNKTPDAPKKAIDAPGGDAPIAGTAEATFAVARVTTLAGASPNAGAVGTFMSGDLVAGTDTPGPALSNSALSALPGAPPKVIFLARTDAVAFDAVDIAVEGQSGYFEIPAGDNNTFLGLDLVTQASVPNTTTLTIDFATRTGTDISAVTTMTLFVSQHQFIAAGDLQNHDTCQSDVADLFGAVLEGNQGSPVMPMQVITNHDNNTDIGSAGSASPGVKGDIGPFPTGHREVVWDGVPEVHRDTPDFPEQFFNRQLGGSAGVQAGATFTPGSGGTGLEVNDVVDGTAPGSGPPTGTDAPFGGDFSNINTAYEGDMLSFTQNAAFAPLGTNSFQITFNVAASDTEGFVIGAGVVFVSVDAGSASSIEFFDANGTSLNKTFVPPRTAGPFPIAASTVPGIPLSSTNIPYSFAGWIDDAKQVKTVVVTNGQIAVDAPAANDKTGQPDVVVVDDVYYAEPKPAQ